MKRKAGRLRITVDRIGVVTFLLVVAFPFIFMFLPIFFTIVFSLDSRQFLSGTFPSSLSLRWYEEVFNSRMLMQGLRTSLLLGAISVSFAVVMGILGSFALVRYDFKGKEALMSFALTPLVTPGVVTGFALLGFFSSIGVYHGFERLLLGHIILTIPYTLRTIVAVLVGFDRTLEEAAMNLGASKIQTFRLVTLPLIRPGVVSAAVIAFAFSLDDVSMSVFLSDISAQPFSVVLFSSLKTRFDPFVAAGSTLLTILMFLVVVAIEKSVGLDKFVGMSAGFRT